MPFPKSEADRLNTYLDARVQGQQADPDGLDPALADAYERIKALDARSAPDPHLMTDLWRTMMSAIPADAGQRPSATAPALPSRWRETEPGSKRTLGGFATAMGVIALLIASAIGYQRFIGESGPGQPTTVPAAFQPAGTPSTAGCDVEAREPGSIAEIVATPQTQLPYLPRFGPDPVFGEAGGRPLANGDFLLNNSSPDAEPRAEIERTLDQLAECRIYATDHAGRIDMEGRYFALFSDDYFRRELSGYQEAGAEPQLGGFWSPTTAPTIVETRRLHGFEGPGIGNQVLAILESQTGARLPGTLVLVFVEVDDRWLVDEVGYAEMPSGETTPVPSRPTPVPGAWLDQFPLQLDIALYDAETGDRPPLCLNCDAATPAGMSGGLDPTVCSPLDQGTPVPCGASYQRHGPYWYNEFPANTDFTINLYNLGEQPHRFEVADLGISIEVAPGGEELFVLNADPGEYLFTIYEGEQPDPIGAGVFTFISLDEGPTMG